MLIVNEGEPFGFADANIRELPAGPGRTLGELRNVALRAITDGLVLQWDDDDIYGRDRITHQVATGWPNLLREEILWNTITDEARVGNASKWRWGGFPGTILHAADSPHRYPPKPRHEDSEFATKFGKLRSCDVGPADYIRTFTSGSTSGEQHFGLRRGAHRPALGRPAAGSGRVTAAASPVILVPPASAAAAGELVRPAADDVCFWRCESC